MGVSLINMGDVVGNTITIPSHRAGDLIIVYAANAHSTAIPSLDSNFTNVSLGNSSGSSTANRVAYRIPTSDTSSFSSSWGSSTDFVIWMQFRVGGGVGTLGIGASNGGAGAASVAGWPAMTLTKTDGTSTLVGFQTTDSSTFMYNLDFSPLVVSNLPTSGTKQAAAWSADNQSTFPEIYKSAAFAVYREAQVEITYTAPAAPPPVTGTFTKTEAADTVAASGSVVAVSSGPLAVTSATDSIAASGTVISVSSGALAATDDPDVCESYGDVLAEITGTLDAYEVAASSGGACVFAENPGEVTLSNSGLTVTADPASSHSYGVALGTVPAASDPVIFSVHLDWFGPDVEVGLVTSAFDPVNGPGYLGGGGTIAASTVDGTIYFNGGIAVDQTPEQNGISLGQTPGHNQVIYVRYTPATGEVEFAVDQTDTWTPPTLTGWTGDVYPAVGVAIYNSDKVTADFTNWAQAASSAGSDTMAADGTVPLLPIEISMDAVEDELDTAYAEGFVADLVQGPLAASETSDTLVAAGNVVTTSEYYFTQNVSDITGSNYNFYLTQAAVAANTWSWTITSTKVFWAFAPQSDPGVAGKTTVGPISVAIKVTTGANINMTPRLERITAAGTVVNTSVAGGAVAAQNIATPGVYTFTIPNWNSGAWAATDRLRLRFDFTGSGSSQAVAWEFGGSASKIVVPWKVAVTSLATTESNDTLVSSGTIQSPVTGPLAVTEPSDSLAATGFPQPQAVAYVQAASSLTDTVTLGVVQSGDLLMALAHRRGDNTAITLPTGWTSLQAGNGYTGSTITQDRYLVAYKISDGTETSVQFVNATEAVVTQHRQPGGAVTPRQSTAKVQNSTGSVFTTALAALASNSWYWLATAASDSTTAPTFTGLTSRRHAGYSTVFDTNTVSTTTSASSATAPASTYISMVAVELAGQVAPAYGPLAATSATDGIVATGTVRDSNSLQVTETTFDTFAAVGGIGWSGPLAATEASDTFAGTAAILPPITGALAKTEPLDTLAASGAILVPLTATLATTEAKDTAAASGTVTEHLGLAATEASDTFAGRGFKNYSVFFLSEKPGDFAQYSMSRFVTSYLDNSVTINLAANAQQSLFFITSVNDPGRDFVSGGTNYLDLNVTQADSRVSAAIRYTMERGDGTDVGYGNYGLGTTLGSTAGVYEIAFTNTPTSYIADDARFVMEVRFTAGSGGGQVTISLDGSSKLLVPYVQGTRAGTMLPTEAADVSAITGTLDYRGPLAATDSQDVLAASGATITKATLATTEAKDVSSIDAIIVAYGYFNFLSEPADGMTGSGAVIVEGALLADEPTDAIFAYEGNVSWGPLRGTEAGDGFTGQATARTLGMVFVTDAPDGLVSTGVLISKFALEDGGASNEALSATVRRPATMTDAALSGTGESRLFGKSVSGALLDAALSDEALNAGHPVVMFYLSNCVSDEALVSQYRANGAVADAVEADGARRLNGTYAGQTIHPVATDEVLLGRVLWGVLPKDVDAWTTQPESADAWTPQTLGPGGWTRRG